MKIPTFKTCLSKCNCFYINLLFVFIVININLAGATKIP